MTGDRSPGGRTPPPGTGPGRPAPRVDTRRLSYLRDPARPAGQDPRGRAPAVRTAAVKLGGRAAVAGLNAIAAGAGTAARHTLRGARLMRRSPGSTRAALLVAALPVLVCCGAGALVLTAAVVLFDDEERTRRQQALEACAVPLTEAGELDDLDDEQWAHGELIVRVGVEAGAPPRAWVIAVATAMQESSLRNLPHLGDDNDHDSLGLFQQRPSQGWGTPEQILDPEYAAAAFYQRLLAVDGWQELPLTRAAQAVQVSAHPDAYARHEPLAVALVDAVTGGMAVAAAFDDGAARCTEWFEVNAAGWTRPAPGPVWSGFRTASRPEHYGVDIGAPRSTPVRAASDGRVIHVTCDATLDGRAYGCDVDGSPAVSGCGWYLDIQHAGGVVTRYCHLLRHPEVVVGEQVAAGQRIGSVGSSGRSSGPHLHFEVELRTTAGAQSTVERRQTDPVAFLAARGVVMECHGSPADCQPVHGDRVRQR